MPIKMRHKNVHKNIKHKNRNFQCQNIQQCLEIRHLRTVLTNTHGGRCHFGMFRAQCFSLMLSARVYNGSVLSSLQHVHAQMALTKLWSKSMPNAKLWRHTGQGGVGQALVENPRIECEAINLEPDNFEKIFDNPVFNRIYHTWLKSSPNVKLCRPLGREVSSKLWLNSMRCSAGRDFQIRDSAPFHDRETLAECQAPEATGQILQKYAFAE